MRNAAALGVVLAVLAGSPALLAADAAGTRATRLAGAIGDSGVPSWSPDGSMVAYIAEQSGTTDLYVVSRDGTARRRLTTGAAPVDAPAAWSPDGRAIAFTSEDSREGIWVVRSDGSGLRRVTAGADLLPAWSPDGAMLAFTRYEDDRDAFKAYVVSAGGGKPVRLSPGGEVDDLLPAWSPDGTRLVFTSGTFELLGASVLDVWSMRADGTARTRLTATGESFAFPYPWSPDGTQIAYLTEEGRDRIWVMSADGSAQRPVGPPGIAFTVIAPWSPDSRTLLYANEDDSAAAVWLLDVATGSSRRVAHGDDPEANPAWSPDGAEIAFERQSRFPRSGRLGPAELFAVTVVDGKERALAGVPRIVAANGERCERIGTTGNDVIRGTAKPEVICGRGGDDVILAGGGADLVDGGAGSDRILGQGGDDIFLARDGRRDAIDGGLGRDSARLDVLDLVKGVEVRL